MKRSPYHTPRFLKFKSELLRCAIVVLLMSGVVLRASEDYDDIVPCPGGLPCDHCCLKRTFVLVHGEPEFTGSEIIWNGDCTDKDDTPKSSSTKPAGTPIEDESSCQTCSLAPSSDPTATGGTPAGDPETLGDSFGQFFSLGTNFVESPTSTEDFTEEPVGTVSVDLEPGPVWVPDPVDPVGAPPVLNPILVSDVRSFVKDLSSGNLTERSGVVSGRNVRQFLAPQALFTFTEQQDGSLSLQVNKASQVLISTDPAALHAVAAGDTPATYLTFMRYEEPVTHENFINIFGVSNGQYYGRMVGGTVNADGSGGSFVELKGGLRIETLHTYIKTTGENYGRPDLAALAAEDADGNIHVETITTSRRNYDQGTWVPITNKVRIFQTLMVGKKEVMLEESLVLTGANGPEELTTRNTYEDDFVVGSSPATSVNKAYGQLSSRENPDGSWILYDFDVVTGMAWRIYRPWLGTPATLAEARAMTPAARMAACQVEEFLYSSGDPTGEVGRLVTIQGVVVAQQIKTMTDVGTTRVKTSTTTRKRLAADGSSVEYYQTTQIRTYTLSGTGLATLVSQKNDDGSLTLYDTKPGDFDPATSAFTPSAAGLHRAATVISPALAGGQAVPGQTRKQITITNEVGQTMLETTAIATNSAAALAAQYGVFDGRKYTYDGKSRLITTATLDGTVVEDVSYVDYLAGFTRTVKDAAGVATLTQHELDGTETYRSRLALTDGADTLAEDTSTISMSSDENGGGSVETKWDYGVLTVTKRDAAGRVVEQYDQQNRLTSYAYARAAVDGHSIYRVTETRPNGATRISERYIDGHVRSITGTGVVAEHHGYQVNADGTVTETVHTGAADGPRWVSMMRDGSGGAVLKETRPSPAGGAATTSTLYHHDNAGRVVRTVRPGLGDQISEYDDLGNAAARGVDMNGNHVLDRSGTDVVTEFTSSITANAGHGDETQTTGTYTTDGSATVLTRTVVRRIGCGGTCSSEVNTTEPDGTVRAEITTVNRTTGLKTITRKETRPGSGERTLGTQRYLAGFLMRETLAGVNGDIVHEYGWGGRIKTTDPRTGIMRWNYAGMTAVLTSTSTGPGYDLKTTSYAYYPATGLMAGQLQTITHPDLTTTTREYDLMGRVTFEGGTATYAVKHEFDELGQHTTMRTRRNAETQVNDGDWDTTTWAYQPGTGKLESKTDAAAKAMTYTYDAAGQLHTRIWARKEDGGTADLVTTYAYDPAGRLTGTDYSDDTPDVTIALDRAGRAREITDASGTRTSAFDGPGGALSAVSYEGAGSPLEGCSVSYAFDDDKRRSAISVMQGAATLSTTGYTYEPTTGRMATVTHGGQSVTYDWTAQVAGLPGTVTYSGIGITGTRTPDAHGRLDDITWRQGAGAASPVMLKNDYTLDDRGRRTATTREDSTYNWSYGYNGRGEVTSGTGPWLYIAPQPSTQHLYRRQFAYQYDEIGNRKQASEAEVPDFSQTTTYTPNALNQYSAITNPDPGKRKIKGRIAAGTTVNVGGSGVGLPTGGFSVNNGAVVAGTQPFTSTAAAATTNAPAYLKVTVEGRKAGAGVSGQTIVYKKESGFYFPPRNETPAYDEDGNLILDGRWDWKWDAENRLKSMETNAAAIAAGVPSQRIEFVYDSQSRRVRKVVKSFSSQANGFVVTSDTRFLYDGWNVIAEFTISPSLPVSSSPRLDATYAWGLDLSGTETGAGGVGGLLMVSLYSPSTINPQLSATLAPLYDGNGNVLAYAVCSTGQIVARYEYDPFGKLLIKDEDASVAGRLHHQFSTKYKDEETGLSYYGFRYYRPEDGRFIGRDPIGERGGINLYAAATNGLINQIDVLGLLYKHYGSYATLAEAEAAAAKLVTQGVKYCRVTAVVSAAVTGWQVGEFINENTSVDETLGQFLYDVFFKEECDALNEWANKCEIRAETIEECVNGCGETAWKEVAKCNSIRDPEKYLECVLTAGLKEKECIKKCHAPLN